MYFGTARYRREPKEKGVAGGGAPAAVSRGREGGHSRSTNRLAFSSHAASHRFGIWPWHSAQILSRPDYTSREPSRKTSPLPRHCSVSRRWSLSSPPGRERGSNPSLQVIPPPPLPLQIPTSASVRAPPPLCPFSLHPRCLILFSQQVGAICSVEPCRVDLHWRAVPVPGRAPPPNSTGATSTTEQSISSCLFVNLMICAMPDLSYA
jgi:hypothetical protein